MMVDIAIAAISSFRIWDNRDWQHEFWSTGCEDLFGYTVQELMADKNLWLSQVFPEDRQTIVMPMFEAFFAQRNATAEYRFHRKDGSVRWISSNYACQKIEGNSWTIAGVHQDISDRKQSEISLQSREEKLRLALDLNAIGIWEWSIATGDVFWNASHYIVLGYQPGEIEPSYQRWRDRVHPDDIGFAEQRITQALETHTDYEAEFRLLLDDGSIRWLHSKGRAIYDEAGKPLRMVGVEYDITDRKQAEAQLRQAGEMDAFRVELSDVLRSLSDPVQIQAEACRLLGEHLGVDRAYYVEVNEAEGYARVDWNYLRGDSPSLVGDFRLVDYGWILPHLCRGETVAIADVEKAEIVPAASRPMMAAVSMAAHISLPIIKAGTLMGALCITEPVPRQWSATEIELVRETAERIWATIERARAEAALRESEAKLARELKDTRLLQSISSQLIQGDDIETICQQILNGAIAIMGSDMGSMQMLVPETHQLLLLTSQGFNPQAAEFWKSIETDSGSPCGAALKRGKRVMVPDVETCEFIVGTEDLHFFRLSGIRAAQSTPLISRQGQLVGMITTHWREIHTPSERELRLLDVLARQAADVLERARAAVALRESEAKYRSLFDSIDEGFSLIEMIFDRAGEPINYRFLEVNQVFERQTGLVGVSGKTILDFIPNIERSIIELYGRVAIEGKSVRFEQCIESMDDLWFSIYASRVGGDGSRQVAVVFDNITDRKRREANVAFLAEIAEDFSRLSTVEEIIQAVGAKLGAYLNITTCNFCEIDEVRDQVIYLGRWNTEGAFRLPDRICLSEQVSEEFRRRVRAGETVVSENTQTNPVTNAKANASIGALSFITVPFHKDGEWKYLFSINDIVPRNWREDEIELVREVANRTFPRLDRARAEADLRQNEQLLRLALAGAKAGSWDWEIATSKLTWSPEMYHLYGLDRDRIDPANDPVQYDIWYNNYLHPDDRQWVSEYLSQVLKQHLPEIQVEHRIFHPEHGFRWLLGLGRLTVNERGEPQRFNGITLDISDRKQTELALQESEQRLSLFVKCAPVSVAMFDRNMNYIAVSQRWLDIYHLGSIPEVIGRSHYELLPTIPERWRQVHQQGLEGFIQRCDEDSFTLPDGSQQWLRWEVQPWEMASGEVGGILIFVEDITDRKQAELMRQQQLEREQAIADMAQDIRRSLDLNQVLSRTVERVRHLLNADRVIIFRFRPDWHGEVVVESVGAEWIPILSTTIFDPCFEERYIEPYRQGRIATMTDIDAENLEPCYVELLKPFQVKANLVIPLLQNEQLWGLLIAHQCSAPRQWQNAEIELLQQLANHVSIAIQQSELYQKIREQAALIDIATDAIFVRDLNNCILFWNQGSERLYGWTVEEALGKTADELFERESASELAENLLIVAEKGFWQGELEQVTKSGKEVKIASRWTLVRDESGQPKSILVVNSDITEKKQLEKQFYRAQRLESIGTLASGIAHDFNNILTPMLAVSHLLPLKFPHLDEQTRQMLEILEVSANRGASLVKQVLSFSRGQEGKRVILQVEHLLSEIVTIANRTFPKSIQICTEIPRMELWTISADTTQIHQVLMNLIVNARDAMPNGGSLTISAENRYLDENYAGINLEAQVGSYVILSISDTGMGIPPELLERIFDPFFTTKEVGKGTGLGLATVLGIVKNHGGFVKVYSEVGNGTQFQVYLPASEGRLSQPILDEELPIGNGELILIVDDEPTIREIAKTSLEKYNYRTLFASDGIEALSIYGKHQQEISVVLIDLMMPNLDGLTAIRAMQKMNPQVKAIVTSGLSANSELALSVNVKTFLLKPYTLKDLLTALHEVISTTNSQTD